MSAPNDGGPAFPETGLSGLPNGDFLYGRSGMSLRDYFAAKAMQGFCVNHDPGSGASPEEIESGAQVAYAIADAMLKAREVAP